MGKHIDTLPISKYSLYVAVGLLVAAVTMALSMHIALLFVAILLLRLAGQGLSGHTAETAMARHYNFERGKALSISSLGYPIGEAILPIGVATLLAVTSWRTTWGLIAALIGLVFIPFVLFVSKKARIDHFSSDRVERGDSSANSSVGNVYRNIFSERRFWMILPAVILPPFWVTGLFLYQVSIAEQLGWTATLIASAFIFFAATRIVSSLSIGPFIDKLGAGTIYKYYLLPFAVGLMVAFMHPGLWSAFLYMAMIGLTMGIGSTTKSALLAELYGSKIVGTVRSLFASVTVFSTAVSPFLMGWMLDKQVSMNYILMTAAITLLIGTALAIYALPEKGNTKKKFIEFYEH